MSIFRGPRVVEPELMNHADPADVEANLRDLDFINRWLGGYAAMHSLVDRYLPEDRRFTILETGAATGAVGRELARLRPQAEIYGLDLEPRHLELNPFDCVAADAFAPPFRDHSFDYLFSCLFLHHFEAESLVTLLRQFRRLSRRGVLAVDLERHRLAKGFLPATRHLFRWNRLTLHDGPVSVQAAFTAQELKGYFLEAGFKRVEVRRHDPWFRLSVWAER